MYAVTGGPPPWIAVSLASAAGLVMLVNRMHRHDLLTTPESLINEESPSRPPEPPLRAEIVTSSHAEKVIKIDNLGLRRDQWQQLAEAIGRNDGKLVRDIIPAGTFTSLTRRWQRIVGEFRRLELIGPDQRLTETGVQWFAQFSPTLPERLALRYWGRPDDDDDEARRWLEELPRGRS
jgi:hypothetical protein